MFAEWSAECSAEDAVLVVPWADPDGHSAFVDLRANPYDLDNIAEAEQHPPLMQALRALNAARSPVFTAKCDAWTMDADELALVRHELDLAAADFPAGFASYIDLLWQERNVFTSFHQHEQLLDRLARHVERLERPSAALDCVIRPAMIDFDGPQEGFAVSLYVKALGPDGHAALAEWSAALESVVGLIRGKELSW
jgi:hypothetical protein